MTHLQLVRPLLSDAAFADHAAKCGGIDCRLVNVGMDRWAHVEEVGFDPDPATVQRVPVPDDLIAKPPKRVYGERYHATDGLDVAALAKLMRADIKAAVKAGDLPQAKYSVRISRYSMGQSIDVIMRDAPFQVREETTITESWGERNRWVYTAEAARCAEVLSKIHHAYNRDGSDLQSDYFDVRYYGGVTIEGNE